MRGRKRHHKKAAKSAYARLIHVLEMTDFTQCTYTALKIARLEWAYMDWKEKKTTAKKKLKEAHY